MTRLLTDSLAGLAIDWLTDPPPSDICNQDMGGRDMNEFSYTTTVYTYCGMHPKLFPGGASRRRIAYGLHKEFTMDLLRIY